MDGQVPVEIPGILTPQMTIAIGHPLVGCQFIRSNRTVGMKFVRADAYYRSQAIILPPDNVVEALINTEAESTCCSNV